MFKNNKKTIESIIEKTLKLLGTKCKIRSRVSNEALYVSISSPDSNLLIGRQGENLAALQYICRLMILPQSEFKQLILDVDGYKEAINDHLLKSVIATAKNVSQSKKPEILEPMNSYERRLIHTALQNVDGVVTKSVGEGRDRRLIISPE